MLLVARSLSASHQIAISWTDDLALREGGFLYLLLAGISLLIALRFMRRALVPIGPLLQAAAAVAVVALAVTAALVLLVAAAFAGR